MTKYTALINSLRDFISEAVPQTFSSDQAVSFSVHLSIEGTSEEPHLALVVTPGGSMTIRDLMPLADLMSRAYISEIEHLKQDLHQDASFEPYNADTGTGMVLVAQVMLDGGQAPDESPSP